MKYVDLSGRTALVTGGSGGIGAALSRELAAAGVSVAVHYRDHEADALAVGGALVVQADLAEAAACGDLVARVEAELGPIDILAANAGAGAPASWQEVDAEAFDRMYAVNLRAPFLLARRVLPGMIERGFGRVLFTSSIAALTGGVVGPHYAASKAGMHGLTHAYAKMLALEGITANTIAPALIATEMVTSNPRATADLIPVGRFGQTEEVAAAAEPELTSARLARSAANEHGPDHAPALSSQGRR